MASISRSDIARLVLRVGVGGVMTAHGTQKLFGWFGGGGLEGTAGRLESAGFRPGRLNAIVAGVTETAGGVLLAAGLATPSTGAAVTSTMAVAAATHAPQGFFAMKGGYEYPAVLGLASGTLALAGAGKLSLDELLHQRLGGGRLALFSAVVTAGATALVLRRRQAALAEQNATTASAAGTDNVTTGPVSPPAQGEPTTSLPPRARSDRFPIRYRIVVQGEVTPRSAESLGASIIESIREQTVLDIEIVDQGQLYRTLDWLYEHGLELIRLHPVGEENRGTSFHYLA